MSSDLQGCGENDVQSRSLEMVCVVTSILLEDLDCFVL